MHAVLDTLTLSGIAFLLAGGMGAWFLVNPPATPPPTEQACPTAGHGNRSYTTGEMLETKQFWLLWLMLFST